MEPNQNETITCPYCENILEAKPKRSKKCPFCKNRIAVYKGVLYQEKELFRKLREERHQASREHIHWLIKRDCAFIEIEFIEIYGTSNGCSFCAKMSGKKIPIEEAIKNPNLLPPFESCQDAFCRCGVYTVRKRD